MEDKMSWPPHSNNRLGIWKHLLNPIYLSTWVSHRTYDFVFQLRYLWSCGYWLISYQRCLGICRRCIRTFRRWYGVGAGPVSAADWRLLTLMLILAWTPTESAVWRSSTSMLAISGDRWSSCWSEIVDVDVSFAGRSMKFLPIRDGRCWY